MDDAGFPTGSRYLISPPSTLHLLAQKGTGLFFCSQISEIIVFFLQSHLSPYNDIWYSAIRISLAFAQGPILGVVFVIKGNSTIKLEGFTLRRSYCLILCIYENFSLKKGSIKERKYESKKAKSITCDHLLQHDKTTSYLPTA